MDTKSRLSDSIHSKLYLQETRIRNKWYESTNAYIYIPYGQVGLEPERVLYNYHRT